MSKYTITIKNLIDNNFDFQMTQYPIIDENYRETLNHNILYHYYEDEIGLETAPLFRLYLNQRLNEIMPKYNELYKAQKNLIDNNKNLFQDTPQGNIPSQDIDAQNVYASNITLDRNTTSNTINDTSSGTGSGTNAYVKTIIGNNGGKYNIDILKDIENNFMNIDLMIINELSDLFMGIY